MSGNLARARVTATGTICSMILLMQGAVLRSETITFDDLSNLPARTSSSSFAAANGGSDTFDEVTFPSTFAVSGDQNTVTASAGPFLIPHSGDYAGYGFGNTIVTTSLILDSVYVGSTSLQSAGDGVTALTIEALGSSNQVLDSISVSGLTLAPKFVDTSAFASLSGITGYEFRVDASGANNPRFSIDDIQLSAVPEPTTLITMSLGTLGFLGLHRIARSDSSRRGARMAGGRPV